MDVVESPLNQAHQLERKAELLLRASRFDDSITCHQQTADLLLQATKLTTSQVLLDSLHFQHKYHINRQSVIKHKKALYERQKIMDDKQDYLPDEIATKQVAKPPNATEDIQMAIYRNIAERDSLLQFLKRGTEAETRNVVADGNSDEQQIIRSAVKIPKDDKMLIEELQMNNSTLRQLVEKLFSELERSQAENCHLRKMLSGLDASFDPSPIQVLDLPPLEPLEMPEFILHGKDEENGPTL